VQFKIAFLGFFFVIFQTNSYIFLQHDSTVKLYILFLSKTVETFLFIS